MVGAIAANLHEGSRSEYLAQYVFASFGTAVSVPHQEDSGIDLYCTLTERVGSRAWVRAYFSVQVKSTMDPWIIEGKESVRWFVEHPFPIFLCIVDKASARIRVYHTSPRYYVWSVPPLPDRIELVPTTEEEGRCTQWQGSTAFLLSAPVLDFSIQTLLNDRFHRQAWDVLHFWIGYDLENLARIKLGIHSFSMPDQYNTNTMKFRGLVTQGITKAPNLASAMHTVKETVAYLSSELYRKGDLRGAVRCAMLLRHFFESDTIDDTHDPSLHSTINTLIRGQHDYLYTGVDSLNAMIDRRLTKAEKDAANKGDAG